MHSCRTHFGLDQLSSARYDAKGRQKEGLIEALHELLPCDLFPMDDGSCDPKPSSFIFLSPQRPRVLTRVFAATNRVIEAEPSECVLYMTANGRRRRVCDGLMDCHDFSDEVACNYCPEGQVHCGVGAACIDVQRRCDGRPDCPNGSDERGCRE